MKPPILFGSFIPSCDDRKPEGVPFGTTSAFRSSKVGFPIRKSTDQSSLAAPRGLSQLTTSFIASQRQGIHQMPLRHLIALIIDAHPSAEEFHADDCLSARIWESTHSEKRPFTCFTCFANHPRMWVSIIDTPAKIAGATTKTIVYTGCPARTFGWFALFTMRNSGVFRRGSIGSTAGNGRIPSDERRQEAASAGAGGARRNRTDDLLLAKQALSQLSYGPGSREASTRERKLVGLGRFELPTSRLSSARSNQLSYKP